jgi:hypothetical protein
VTRRSADEAIEQRTGRIKGDSIVGVVRRRCRPFAAQLARGDRIDKTKHVAMAVVLQSS